MRYSIFLALLKPSIDFAGLLVDKFQMSATIILTSTGRWSTHHMTGDVKRERYRWRDSLLRLELTVLFWEGPRFSIRDYHQVET